MINAFNSTADPRLQQKLNVLIDTKLRNLLSLFFRSLSRSPNTLRAYKYDIFSCITPNTTWIELNDPTRQYWRCALAQKSQLKSNARLIASWKSFFRFCVDQNESVTSGLLKTRPQKVKKRLFVVPTVEAIRSYLARPVETWIEQRNKALCVLLYATGMRIGEALNIRAWKNQTTIRIVGKGDRVREVPVLDIARTEIARYIALCPLNTSQWLFVGRYGEKLTYQVVYKAMLGTPWGNGAHGLRRSAATHLLREEVDVESVRMLLGHAKLSTTQQYISHDSLYLQQRYLEIQKQIRQSQER